MIPVSVIMPVFNAAPFLKEAVQSILSQTMDDLELIAVNDGSTDGSASILEQFNDFRLQIIHIPHSGVFTAMNHGIKAAQGKFFARMDADDISHPDRIKLELELLTESDIDIAGTCVEIFNCEGMQIPGHKNYEKWINGLVRHEEIIRNIFIEDPIPSPTIFMKLSTIRGLGGYDEGVYPDDYNLTLKAFHKGLRFGKHEEMLLQWRDHGKRLSRTAPELRCQRFFEIKANYFAKIRPYDGKNIIIWGIGKNGKALYKALIKAGINVQGFTASPEFIREKFLYGKPVKKSTEFCNSFFVLATAARTGRDTAEKTLTGQGLSPIRDFIAFC